MADHSTHRATTSEHRDRIDQLDHALIHLLALRRDLSWQVQRERVAGGGPAGDPARERVVVRRYLDGLGEGGSIVAAAVLGLCRGVDLPSDAVPVP
ncbi:chorismate mutase [Actinosynnema sp. NPDC004786]